jgi:hypothetical protein
MKTAVEWFIINLIQVCGAPPEGTWKEAENLLQQAKEMEKEQIIDAWNTKSKIDGVLTYTDNRTAEQYYKETFNK